MNKIYTYRTNDEWVAYVELNDGTICLSAHTDNERYSRAMMRAILKTFLQFNDIVTILPFDYLVKFYNKHYNVELINKENNLYRIWR